MHLLIRVGKLNSNITLGVGGPKASRRLLSALTDEKVEYIVNKRGSGSFGRNEVTNR